MYRPKFKAARLTLIGTRALRIANPGWKLSAVGPSTKRLKH